MACFGGAAPYHCPPSPCIGCPHRTIYQIPVSANSVVVARCPVCGGAGQLPTGEITTAGVLMKTCHGCNGNGWVTP